MIANKLEFNLPYPPSVNQIHTVARGRIVLSSVARRYYKNVKNVLRESGLLPSPFNGERLSVIVLTHQPDKRRRDIQNLPKILLDSITKKHEKKILRDALSETGIWNDDEQIDDFRIIRGDLSRNDAYVEIKIKVFNNDEVIKEWSEF